ncbi:FAD-binding domain-containing protein [Venturia nashicola]|uniref:FAD-binding domain-containing protein n=1 Tax=Venturia nashicola TaxID=86259 RepID=A0A4Z1NX67_9PEZI|nr:FAD-binding domain-containing protein [Venturia nashicola]
MSVASFLYFTYSVVALTNSGAIEFGNANPLTKQVCSKINKILPGRITFEGSREYRIENKDYWSIALSELKPACIALPTSAQEVSIIINAINDYPGAKFVVKSGGHSPNPGQASCSDCVLIAMKNMKGTVNDPARGVAYVQPGGTWSSVITPLVKQGVTVVGGRLGLVGIGGYLTQGGLSFLSAQYGMAGDSIVEMETVLPNGTIANINAQNNPDVLVAMRGSGDQFGIVTRFTLKTYKIDKVWGGYRIFTGMSQRAAINTAFHDFIQDNEKDPKAAIICNHEQAAGGRFFMVFFFYDGEEPPEGAFGKFEDIKATVDFTATRGYDELLNFNARGADMLGARTSFRSITLPRVPSAPDFYSRIQASWENITAEYVTSHHTSVLTIAQQAFPAVIGKKSAALGGNAMGLTANDSHRFILEITCLWKDDDEDGLIYAMSKQLTDSIEGMLKQMRVQDIQGIERYNPYFANDATFDQDVLGSYKDAQKFKALQRAVDPQGLFAKHAGGFKYL